MDKPIYKGKNRFKHNTTSVNNSILACILFLYLEKVVKNNICKRKIKQKRNNEVELHKKMMH